MTLYHPHGPHELTSSTHVLYLSVMAVCSSIAEPVFVFQFPEIDFLLGIGKRRLRAGKRGKIRYWIPTGGLEGCKGGSDPDQEGEGIEKRSGSRRERERKGIEKEESIGGEGVFGGSREQKGKEGLDVMRRVTGNKNATRKEKGERNLDVKGNCRVERGLERESERLEGYENPV